jgi:hypothetical protein
VLKRKTEQRLRVPLYTLDYRHAAVGIRHKKVSKAFSKGYDDNIGKIEKAEVDKKGKDIIELQNSRTTRIEVGNYAVLINIVKHLSMRSINMFRPLSII